LVRAILAALDVSAERGGVAGLVSIADMTFSWPRPTWLASALR
jgi:hypothetical protein